ncbi:hypothetical protein D3C71_2037950 [compost metagenome]
MVARGITHDHIVAEAANGILYGHALGDGHVLLQSADIRKRCLVQINDLVLAVARKIKGVVATRIPHREHQLLLRILDREEVAFGI